MAAGYSLDVSPSATATQGPSSVGADFSSQFSSPFAVGRGATASSTASQGGGSGTNTALYVAIGALVVAMGIGAVILAKR